MTDRCECRSDIDVRLLDYHLDKIEKEEVAKARFKLYIIIARCRDCEGTLNTLECIEREIEKEMKKQ